MERWEADDARRRHMARFGRRDTAPELALRRELHRRGRRFFVDRPVRDDRFRRTLTAPDLLKLRLTDSAEHPTGEGKLYLCAVKDACSRRIVAYSIPSGCGPRSPSPPCE